MPKKMVRPAAPRKAKPKAKAARPKNRMDQPAPAEAAPPPPAAPPTSPTRIALRFREDNEVREITIKDWRGSLSFFWSHVVRSRGRWRDDTKAKTKLVKDARERFAELDLNEEHLYRIARAGVVEVSIPFVEEDRDWAPRILPWEFLLSEMTREFRTQPLVVIRHLDVKGKSSKSPGEIKSSLFVENNPAPFDDRFDFDTERELVNRQLGLAQPPLMNPSLDKLRQEVKDKQPDVIHLAGFDSHQAIELIEAWEEELPPQLAGKRPHDGLVMDARQQWTIAEAEPLAGALAAGGGPELVAFNCYNSGARLAPMAVAHGARAAIGFYDSINDAVAERFFAIFYQRWRLLQWNLGKAFQLTMQELRRRSSTEGAVIVLWSRDSLIAEITRSRSLREELAEDNLRSRLFASVVVSPRVNYSRLHAGEPLFDRFNIYRRDRHPLPAIDVEVILHVGEGSFPYREQIHLDADDTVCALEDKIKLPLLSRTQRSLREGITTSLYYSISCQETVIERRTLSVELSAINDWWWDPTDDSRYLASFILPRDPAVLQVVDTAQKYLCALRDDAGAGFDGYQSVGLDPESEDRCEPVDLQVRAIWSALSFELPISYINPPPSFAYETQRLRSPSEVVNGRRGTCIDLALLFAACLEFVEIHAVVFVLKDHAFPGYWRSEESYAKFKAMDIAVGSNAGPASNGADQAGASFSEFDDMMRHIQAGDLVPVETVCLTGRKSFSDAVEQALTNFEDRGNWGALLDLNSAREKGATPMPVLQEEK